MSAVCRLVSHIALLATLIQTPFPCLSSGLPRSFGDLPLVFEPNQGQADRRVSFVSHGQGFDFWLEGTRTVLSRRGSKPGTRPTIMTLLGADPCAAAEGLEKLTGHSHYFTGNQPGGWHRDIPHYARVKVKEVYPGIDLVYYGNQMQLEHDFIVNPGADPSTIRLEFDGAPLRLSKTGDLILGSGKTEALFRAPVAYQGLRTVTSRYVLLAEGVAGFETGPYDKNSPLVIDPLFTYSTFFGGSGSETGYSIAVDNSSNAYIAGETTSYSDFPVQAAYQDKMTYSGVSAFVTKINASGDAVLYSTYLTGSTASTAYGIAVDSAGNAYIIGETFASDFPLKNALQTKQATGFLTKLNATGNDLVYSTYLGSNQETLSAIAVDGSGNAVIAGSTNSTAFPVANALQPSKSSPEDQYDAIVTKINGAGTGYVFSTYLGGNGGDFARSVAVDSAGNVYVTGSTASSNFPLANAFQGALKGIGDAFVTKLNPLGTAMVYSTYLGGNGDDSGKAIAADTSGNAHFAGTTASQDFPMVNPLYPAAPPSGKNGVFIAKLTSPGNGLVYSTYFPGAYSANTIAVDSSGAATVAGGTESDTLPIRNAMQPSRGGSRPDGYVARISALGDTLLFSSFLGGADFDEVRGIAINSSGDTFLTGQTNSTDFPVKNPIQSFRGYFSGDAFITRLDHTNPTPSLSPTPSATRTRTATPAPTPPCLEGQRSLNWAFVSPMPTPEAGIIAVFLNGLIFKFNSGRMDAYDPQTDQWSPRSKPPFGGSAGVVLNGTIYSVGNSLCAYNPSLDTWTVKAPLNIPRSGGLGAAAAAGKIFAMGGERNGSAPVEAYDPGTNTWQVKASMPTPRSNLAAVTIGGIVYALGGQVFGQGDFYPHMVPQVEAYDPLTDSWSAKPNLPYSAEGLVALNFNGVLAALGGEYHTIGVDFRYYDFVTFFDAQQQAWTQQTPMKIPRGFFGAAVSGSVIFAMGGQSHVKDCNIFTSTFDSQERARYDCPYSPTATRTVTLTTTPSSPTHTPTATLTCAAGTTQDLSWTAKAAMPLCCGAAEAAGTKIYVVGRENLQVYDASTDSWSFKAPLPAAKDAFATAECRGLIYAIGGGYSEGSCNTAGVSVESYDPTANTWIERGPLPEDLGSMGAASINGIIYVAGGYRGATASYRTLSFDPDTDVWTPLADMPSSGPVNMVAFNGKLYAIRNQYASFPNVEFLIFDPALNSWTQASIPALDNVRGLGIANGLIYTSGETPFESNDRPIRVYAYDPGSSAWSPQTPLRSIFGAYELVGIENKLFAFSTDRSLDLGMLECQATSGISNTFTSTPSPSQTPTASPSRTVTLTPTFAMGSPTQSATPSTPTLTRSMTWSPSTTRTPSGTPSRTATTSATPSRTRTSSPSSTPSPSPTPTSAQLAVTRTATLTPTPSRTPVPSPTATATPTTTSLAGPGNSDFGHSHKKKHLVPSAAKLGENIRLYAEEPVVRSRWKVYDMAGILVSVVDESGEGWNTARMAPGVYVAVIEMNYPDGTQETVKRKIVVLK